MSACPRQAHVVHNYDVRRIQGCVRNDLHLHAMRIAGLAAVLQGILSGGLAHVGCLLRLLLLSRCFKNNLVGWLGQLGAVSAEPGSKSEQSRARRGPET